MGGQTKGDPTDPDLPVGFDAARNAAVVADQLKQARMARLKDEFDKSAERFLKKMPPAEEKMLLLDGVYRFGRQTDAVAGTGGGGSAAPAPATAASTASTASTAAAVAGKRGRRGSARVDAAAEAGAERAFNDVWRSKTGEVWECITEAAPWKPRAWVGGAAVLHGRMYVMGGGFLGGIHPKSSAVHADVKPCHPSYNDVWSSANGLDWTCAVEHAAWRRRHYHGVIAFDQKLWVLEGTVVRYLFLETRRH